MTADVAVVGVGVVHPRDGVAPPPRLLRSQALDLALADAGLTRTAVDGYVSMGGLEDLRFLGLTPSFNVGVQSGGASAAMCLVTAAGALAMANASIVAISYSNTRPRPGGGGSGSSSYGYPMLYGMFGPPASHALHARRHMATYGTTSLQMAEVAVVQRDYALERPLALGYRQPIGVEDHQASRVVVDPFHLLDCCRDTDIAVTLLVTTPERARDLRQPPVRLAGIGFGHNIRNWFNGEVYNRHDDIEPAARHALGAAGVTLDDIDVAEFYDPHTMSVIMQLEHYGFCGPGEGGPFVAAGETRPTGRIPTNTGGGQLSGWYATGFTPLVEAVHQVRGNTEVGQLPDVEVALVSGHGGNAGVQNTWAHATMVLTGDR
jgi:acetyl-CoA acetyltransferase